MLKIAICDDQLVDRKVLEVFTNEYIKSRDIKAQVRIFEHPDDLISECEKFRPHIYILDIVMPMITGIEAARELRCNQPDAQIIFTTSDKSYALESFDVNPINYIVKPVEKEKLFETLDLSIRRVDLSEEKTIAVKIKGGMQTLVIDDIMYIDYRNHVVTYHLRDKTEISTPTLRIGFAEYISNNHNDGLFVQCHESVCVRVGAIDILTKTDIIVRNNEVIPVSKSRYAQVEQSYMSYRYNI